MPSTGERLATIEEGVKHIREMVTTIDGKLDTLGTRVSHVEKWQAKAAAWIAGAVFVITLIAGAVHLSGCQYEPVAYDSRFPRFTQDIHILYSDELKPCQAAAMQYATKWWYEQGVTRISIAKVSPTHMAILGLPRYGEVGVTSEPISVRPSIGYNQTSMVSPLGEAAGFSNEAGAHSATIRLASCDPWVSAHEIGHVLGLGHNPRPGMLMYYARDRGGWGLNPRELAWVQ